MAYFKKAVSRKCSENHEKKGEKILKGLFNVYSDSSYNKDNILLPAELRRIDCSKNVLLLTIYPA